MRIIFSIILYFLLCSIGWTSNIEVASPYGSTQVQEAINASSAGCTIATCSVTIPSSTVTYAATVNLNKPITLQGTGTPSITSPSGTYAIIISAAARVTGFTFTFNTYAIGISSGYDWLIDNNTFTGAINAIFINAGAGYPPPHGVIFKNTFTNSRVLTFGGSHQSWSADTDLGGIGATYVEGNITNVTGTGAFDANDCNYGGSTVFRWNTINISQAAADAGSYNANFQFHSLQGDNAVRGCRKFEVINNLWISNGTAGSTVWAYIRAGTGVVVNNIAAAYGANGLMVDNVRSCMARDSYPVCDGNATNNLDGNTANYYGYPCRDQLGRGKDASTFVFASPPYPSQAAEPVYQWGNYRYPTLANYNAGTNKTAVNVYVGSADWPCTTAIEGVTYTYHIIANRDFYNQTQHPTYAMRACPDVRTGLTGSCDSAVAGTLGYNVGTNPSSTFSGGTHSGGTR
jgi:hypothetical protein